MPKVPNKYRKKPVEVEACQLTGDNANAVHDWIIGQGGTAGTTPLANGYARIDIHTLEGVMAAYPGDYVIRGVQGEFYPCKPDIFVASYEFVEQMAS